MDDDSSIWPSSLVEAIRRNDSSAPSTVVDASDSCSSSAEEALTMWRRHVRQLREEQERGVAGETQGVLMEGGGRVSVSLQQDQRVPDALRSISSNEI